MAQQSQSEHGTVNINRPYFGHLKLTMILGSGRFSLQKTFISDCVPMELHRLVLYQYAGVMVQKPSTGRPSGYVEAKRTVGSTWDNTNACPMKTIHGFSEAMVRGSTVKLLRPTRRRTWCATRQPEPVCYWSDKPDGNHGPPRS